MQPLLPPGDLPFCRNVVRLTFCNPFLPERIDLERECLGAGFRRRGAVWSRREELETVHPNVERITRRVEEILARSLRLCGSAPASPGAEAIPSSPFSCDPSSDEGEILNDLVTFHLYHHFHTRFDQYVRRCAAAERVDSFPGPSFWPDFESEFQRLAALRTPTNRTPAACAHLFALCFQVRRAFNNIYDFVIGDTLTGARMRAAIWQSIFTHDMKRYHRTLYDRMADFTCLITGPSGSGKELVARAIGLSRFIPFDRLRQNFTASYVTSFIPLNLAALSPTLIESELFGHRKGAFTGALQDRAGYLESCPPLGSVFLDEIGELDGQIQVKLLRLLQSRTFQRIGDTCLQNFRGKFMAATNRDLLCEMEKGRFREDLYYRLCGDVIETPGLREQIEESPEVLHTFIHFISRRLVGEEEAPGVAESVAGWIESNLPAGYGWPGNVRELEQCVRNVVIRNSYRPQRRSPTEGEGQAAAASRLARRVAAASLTLDELLQHYCSLVYARTGSYQETARLLDADHRTVKGRLVPELVEEYGRGL